MLTKGDVARRIVVGCACPSSSQRWKLSFPPGAWTCLPTLADGPSPSRLPSRCTADQIGA
jgi:hypothetical protein